MTDSLWWLLPWVSLVCWSKLSLLSRVTPRYFKLSAKLFGYWWEQGAEVTGDQLLFPLSCWHWGEDGYPHTTGSSVQPYCDIPVQSGCLWVEQDWGRNELNTQPCGAPVLLVSAVFVPTCTACSLSPGKLSVFQPRALHCNHRTGFVLFTAATIRTVYSYVILH